MDNHNLPPGAYAGFGLLAIIILIIAIILCRRLEVHKLLDIVLNRFSKPLNTEKLSKERARVSIVGSDTRRKSLINTKIGEKSELIDDDIKSNYSYSASGRRSTICISFSKLGLPSDSNLNSKRQSIFEIEEDLHKGLDFKKGSIRATIFYEKSKSSIIVNILDVQTVPFQDIDDEYNLYILLALHPGIYEPLRTQMCLKTKVTVFNEEIVLKNVSENQLQHVSLNIKLFSVHDVHDEQLAGEIDLPLNFLLEYSEIIAFDRFFSPEIFNETTKIIFITLTLNTFMTKLTVSATEARNIHIKESRKEPNTYCVIKIKIPGSKSLTRKTSVKYKSSRPSWDEPFTFPIAEGIDLSTIYLTVKLLHKNEDGKFAIGKICFPSVNGATTFAQWEMVVNNPGDPVSEWHRLDSY